MNKKEDRKITLLRACYDLLKKSEESNYVRDACEIEIFYDGIECDGYCLKEDIAYELGIIEED